MSDLNSTIVVGDSVGDEAAASPDAAADAPNPTTTRRHRFFASEAGFSQLVRAMDALAFGVPASVVYSLYVTVQEQELWEYCAVVGLTTMLLVSTFQKFNLYDFETIAQWPRKMLTLATLMAAVLAVMIGLGFAFKISDHFSRVWVFATFASATGVTIIGRGALLLLLRRSGQRGRLRRNVAIVGAGKQAERFLTHLSSERAPWQTIVGVFDDRKTRVEPVVGGYPLVGDLDALVACVRQGGIDIVVITLPWSADVRVLEIIQQIRELPVHVYLASDIIAYRFPAHSQELLAGVPALKIAAAPLSGWSAVAKALEDYVCALLLLVALAPVMAACALAVKLDSPGPVLFRQPRYGFNNRPIDVWKFRSMHHARPPETGVPQATRDDARVTRVGRWLRRTSLDELPQLFNVLGGGMSLVGPRPHAVAHNEQYNRLIAGYSARHRVKPGMTGWAQVNGFRGETRTLDKMEARVTHDIWYIENWSPWLDARILLRTLAIAWRQSQAY